MIEKVDSEVTDTASEDEDEESLLISPATIVSLHEPEFEHLSELDQKAHAAGIWD